MVIEIVKLIIIGAVLLVQSIWDIRIKKVPTKVTLVAAIAGIYFSIMEDRTAFTLFCALLPGMFCLLAGWVTREAIGYGDGILITTMGLYFSFEQLLGICMIALVLGGVVALILFVFFAGKPKDELPFVPCLLAGGIISCVL